MFVLLFAFELVFTGHAVFVQGDTSGSQNLQITI